MDLYMIFITAADTRFYFYLPYMVAQIERYFPESKTIIYDLGMTEQETLQLNEWGVEVKGWHIGPGDPVTDQTYYTRALHKPSMILDALERHPNEPAVYLDADAIPNKRFSVPKECDMAVTLANQYDLAWIEKHPHIEFNGIFNAGVILFGRSNKRLAFVSEWADGLEKSTPIESDQRILGLLLEEMEGFTRREYNITHNLKVGGENMRVRVLEGDVWNLFGMRCNVLTGKDRMLPEDAKVLHFKGNSSHNRAAFRTEIKQGRLDFHTKGVPLC